MRFFKIRYNFSRWSLNFAHDRTFWPKTVDFGQRSNTLANDRPLSHMIVRFRTWSYTQWSTTLAHDQTEWSLTIRFGPWLCTLDHDPLLWTTILHWWFWISIQLWNWNFALGKSQMTDLEVTDSVFDIYMYANRPSHSWNWHLKIFI